MSSYASLARRLWSRHGGGSRMRPSQSSIRCTQLQPSYSYNHYQHQRHPAAHRCLSSSGGGGNDGGDGDNETPPKQTHEQQHPSSKKHQNDYNPDQHHPSAHNKHKAHGGHKSNFAQEVLKPASEGKLTGGKLPHTSGIPHLAARKPKAALEPVRGRAGQVNKNPFEDLGMHGIDVDEVLTTPIDEELDEEIEERMAGAAGTTAREGPGREKMFDALAAGKMGGFDDDDGGGGGYNYGDDGDDEFLSPEEEVAMYAQMLDEDSKFGYWNERDYEDALRLERELQDKQVRIQAYETAVKTAEIQKYAALAASRGEDTETTTSSTAGEGEVGTEGEATAATAATSEAPSSGGKPQLALEDDYDLWFKKNHDLLQIAESDMIGIHGDQEFDTEEERQEYWKNYNTVGDAKYINGHTVGMGVDMNTGLETRYSMVHFHTPNPDSAKEPKPNLPRNRLQPDEAFLESHTRFLYLSGLPDMLDVDGEPADLSKPVNFNLLRTELARLAGTDSTDHVYPATPSSGYIGFADSEGLAAAIMQGPVETNPKSPPVLAQYVAESEQGQKDEIRQAKIQAFVQDAAATLVVSNLPRHHSPASLLRSLFPAGTAVGDAYSNVGPDDILFLSGKRALLRFPSQEEAASALRSPLLEEQLREMGSAYTVRYQRARRNMVHAGFRGPVKHQEVRQRGQKLIVDGDMPTKKFFISHADTLMAWNLDPTVTKLEISQLVQPYCAMRRDIEGSIEFVTCEDYRPTGQAYIGFDIAGEAEAALEALGHKIQLADRTVHLHRVGIRQVPDRYYRGPDTRPDRPIEELLRDLDDWEQHVDPADVKLLEEAGIPKWVIDDSLRIMRYKNETFGPLDGARRKEALEPGMKAGQQYKEIVQLFIQTLKECLPTREEPGLIYEALHLPDQEIDLSIFDREKERQKKLDAHRVAHGGAAKVKSQKSLN